jgi:hypothetical protein
VNEASVSSVIEDALRVGRWRWTHFRPAQDRHGKWKTALTGDAGWPDYHAVRGHEVVAIEAKGRYEQPKPEQQEWLDQLAAAGVTTFVANPATVEEVRDWLLARRDPLPRVQADPALRNTLTAGGGAKQEKL